MFSFSKNLQCSKNFSFFKKNIDILIAISIAVAAFLEICGQRYLDIKNINAVMSGDVAQLYLSNMLFRWEDWHGLSRIISTGFPDAGGTASTGSLSGLGIILKLCKSIFGLSPFYQFNGWWVLINYVFQAIVAVFIFRKLFKEKVYIVLCSTFFILSPILIWRTYAHEMLVSHWLILATFYVYLNNKLTYKEWGLFSIISLIGLYTHPYFVPLTLAIFAALVLQKIIDRKINLKSLMIAGFLWCCVMVLGYFGLQSQGLSGEGGGWRLYSMNVNSLFNPASIGSFFLKDLSLPKGQYEGFQYLGFGIILAFILTLPYFVLAINRKNLKQNCGIIVCCLILTFFALSTKIQFGNMVLFDFDGGFVIDKIGNTFRASGRLFWSVWYVLVFYVFFMLYKNYKRQFKYILPILLLLQIVDLYPAMKVKRKAIKHSSLAPIELRLKSEKWDEIFKRSPFVISPFIMQSGNLWRDLWYLIPKYNLRVSDGYFPRAYLRNNEFHNDVISDIINNNCMSIDNSVIIMSKDHPRAERISGKMHQLDDMLYIESFEMPKCPKKVSIFYSGWSSPEEWGRWSDGKKAKIGLLVDNIDSSVNDIVFNFTIRPYINNKHKKLKVDIYSEGKYLTTWNFELGKNTNTMVSVPRYLIKNQQVVLTFEFDHPKSPKKLGESEDARKLGIGFISVKVLGEEKK